MTPQQYQTELRSFFTQLSRFDSDEEKLRKLDAFKAKRGITQHLKKVR